jgi:hypothetical protein
VLKFDQNKTTYFYKKKTFDLIKWYKCGTTNNFGQNKNLGVEQYVNLIIHKSAK